ncbi:MAG: AAA family ATPase [Caldilineaceae bacterium]
MHSSSPPPHYNLPTQLTPFIGRAEQIAQLAQHLQSHRLLTLTGAGGVGKTRLAIEVANEVAQHGRTRFADGIWFVDLAPLTNPIVIPRRILDLWRVPEQGERSSLEILTTYLSTKQLLLILDNCEHLINACADLAETLLRYCPQLVMLATSREALNISSELPGACLRSRPHINAIGDSVTAPSLPPLSPAELTGFEAVTLFVQRIQAHKPEFALTAANAAAVAHICSRLDGIPLALEMAAARINVFTVEEMATAPGWRVYRRFQLLTGGAHGVPAPSDLARHAGMELQPVDACRTAAAAEFVGFQWRLDRRRGGRDRRYARSAGATGQQVVGHCRSTGVDRRAIGCWKPCVNSRWNR